MRDSNDAPQPAQAPYLPPARQPYVRFWRPVATEPQRMRCLSNSPYVVWTHWMMGRTALCLGPDQGCEVCARGVVQRWAAYLAVRLKGWHNQVVLTLTRGAADQMVRLGQVPPEGAWRGQALEVRRISGGPAGPVSVELFAEHFSAANLPSAIDVPQAVARVLGVPAGPSRPHRLALHDSEGDAMIAGT